MAYQKLCIVFSLFGLVILSAIGQQVEVTIDTDFPGGNVIVDNYPINSTLYYNIKGDTIRIRPDLRDTGEDWFYWKFRVSGAANRCLVFHFPKRKVGTLGPAYSTDGGESWQWLYDKIHEGQDSFVYTFGPMEHKVLFSVGIPYLQANFDRFIKRFQHNPCISAKPLTVSGKGRKIEKLLIGPSDRDPIYKVVVTARHHANEAMASFALEGMIASILEGDEMSSKWLRNNVGFLIIPFVDKDGVEDGDQGKFRIPRDHYLDYSENNIYESTAALRKEAESWGNGQIRAIFDFHCPWLFGEWNEHIYFVGASNEKISKEQKAFVDILRKSQTGELKLDPYRSFLEYGKGWNIWPYTDPEVVGFTEWASTLDGVRLSTILEFPFANNNDQIITPEHARLFGKDVARALAIYLQDL